MTCTTCGANITSADRVCTVCDPWAVRGPESRAKAVAAAGISQDGTVLPKWLNQMIARQLPPELVMQALKRKPTVNYQVLVFYVLLGLVFTVLGSMVDATNYGSLADWRYLATAPIAIFCVLALLFRARKKTRPVKKVGWLIAHIHYIRDRRPDLGLLWLARLGELRAIRIIVLVNYVLLVVLADANLVTKPTSPGKIHALFVVDAVGYFAVAGLAWLIAGVLFQRVYRKVRKRIARPAPADRPFADAAPTV